MGSEEMDLTSSVSRSAVARRLLTISHQTPVCLAFAVRSDTWSRQDAVRNSNAFTLVWMARSDFRAALYLQARRRIVSHSDAASNINDVGFQTARAARLDQPVKPILGSLCGARHRFHLPAIPRGPCRAKKY